MRITESFDALINSSWSFGISNLNSLTFISVFASWPDIGVEVSPWPPRNRKLVDYFGLIYKISSVGSGNKERWPNPSSNPIIIYFILDWMCSPFSYKRRSTKGRKTSLISLFLLFAFLLVSNIECLSFYLYRYRTLAVPSYESFLQLLDKNLCVHIESCSHSEQRTTDHLMKCRSRKYDKSVPWM